MIYGGRGKRFRCRKCHGLVYRSTRQAWHERSDTNADKLAFKICGARTIPNYSATLAALPEELRAAYRDGRFEKSLRDHPKQVIKTERILAAQERWKANPRSPQDAPMTAMGLDVAAGGPDHTTLAWRYDCWYAPIVSVPGAETPSPSDAAALVVAHRRDGAAIIVDVGGGYGGGVVERLKDNRIEAVKFNGAH